MVRKPITFEICWRYFKKHWGIEITGHDIEEIDSRVHNSRWLLDRGSESIPSGAGPSPGYRM